MALSVVNVPFVTSAGNSVEFKNLAVLPHFEMTILATCGENLVQNGFVLLLLHW